jgi:hypothetical protein
MIQGVGRVSEIYFCLLTVEITTSVVEEAIYDEVEKDL